MNSKGLQATVVKNKIIKTWSFGHWIGSQLHLPSFVAL